MLKFKHTEDTHKLLRQKCSAGMVRFGNVVIIEYSDEYPSIALDRITIKISEHAGRRATRSHRLTDVSKIWLEGETINTMSLHHQSRRVPAPRWTHCKSTSSTSGNSRTRNAQIQDTASSQDTSLTAFEDRLCDLHDKIQKANERITEIKNRIQAGIKEETIHVISAPRTSASKQKVKLARCA